jgi:hypothetical protein
MDVIIMELLKTTRRATMWTYESSGMVVHGFSYEVAVDQQRMCHLIDLLLALLRFWSPPMVKALSTTEFSKPVSRELLQYAESGWSITLMKLADNYPSS